MKDRRNTKGLNKVPKAVRITASVLFWLIVWYIAALCIDKEILLPSPLDVFKALGKLITTAEFPKTTGLSVLRIFSGFAVSAAFGFIFGVVSAKSVFISDLLTPIVGVLKATPVASVIILALVWIDKQLIPAAISFLIVFPVIYENTKTGVYNTDSGLLEVARVFGFGKAKTLKLIYFPSVSPYLFAAVKTSLGLAWKSGVAAEVLCQPKFSIGGKLYNSKIYLETTELFAWTVTVIILSFILEKVVLKLFSRWIKAKDLREDGDL